MSEEKNVVLPQEEVQQDTNELRQVRVDKLEAMQAAGKDPFVITKYDQTHHSAVIKESFDELEGKTVRVAGRMMSKRIMGKASFCNIQDLKGNIQSYVARDSIGEEEYKDFKKLDIGDIIGIEGSVFKTKTGEISIHAEKIVLLSKSLLPLPEKFHGLTNFELIFDTFELHLNYFYLFYYKTIKKEVFLLLTTIFSQLTSINHIQIIYFLKILGFNYIR